MGSASTPPTDPVADPVADPEHGYTYDAFISYRHAEPDRSWARWLHQALETWRTPPALVRAKGVRPRLAPIFRDEEELAASADLSREIDQALQRSRFLIVVCSPRAAASRWVNEEVVRFRRMGRGDRVLALLIEGESVGAFPPAMRVLRAAVGGAAPGSAPPEEADPLAADVRPPRDQRPARDARPSVLKHVALLRLLAAMLGCSFDDLRRRDQSRRRRRQLLAGALALAVVATVGVSAALAVRAGQETSQARTDVRTLEAAKRLRDLRERASGLFPSGESRLAEVGPLLEEVRAVSASLDSYRRALTDLELRALEPGSAPPRFADESARAAWHALTGLLQDAEALAGPEKGLVEALARRFERTPAPDAEALWHRCAQEIADERMNPIYRGLRIVPQFGLFPLGKDPDSGLYEFAHLYSGSLPQRGPDRRLVQAEDAGLVFVLLPGAVFWQGAAAIGEHNIDPDSEVNGREGPVHQVRLSAFFLSKYECTQAQWARLSDGAQPSWFQPGVSGIQGTTRRNPVERVSWEDCVGTSGWLRAYGLLLPTEARWEYACRAPLLADGEPVEACDPWWCGPDDERVIEFEVLLSEAGDRTFPVGSKRPNRFGLYDMLGNVSEWCQEFLDNGYYGLLASATPAIPVDPPGPVDRARREVDSRLVRGGNWTTPPSRARASKRDVKWDSARRGFTVGVRPARDLILP